MAAGLVKRIEKITLRAIPVYLFVFYLLITAKPQTVLFFLGLAWIITGQGLRIWATGHLKKNEEVTTTGPYAYVKNPLYLGTLLILVGFCLMANQFLLLVVGVATFIFYYAPYKKSREASRLEGKFGSAWIEYDRCVPDYLPRWTPYESRGNRSWSGRLLLNNNEHETVFIVFLGIMVIGMDLFLS